MYKFNKAILITFLLVSVLILTSCSGSQNSISEDGAAYPAEGGIASPPMMTPSPDVGMDSGYVREDSKYNEYQDEQESGEKIITTISISIESTDFEASINKLKELIDLNNGYLSNSNISNNSYYYQDSFRSGNFTVRIPKEKLNEFLTKIDEIGNVTAENLSSDDVSSYYVDTESRLSVLATKKERLLTLLDKAEKIEDIITLETELGNVIYEMESLKSILI